jgi:hypothetical protein
MKKLGVVLGISVLVSACASGSTTAVQTVQKKDKEMSCTDVLLEMNEAEFYKTSAENKKGAKLRNVLMPVKYLSTYIESGKTIEAADSRISYLNKIYEIMGCDANTGSQYTNRAAPQPVAEMAPMPYPQRRPAAIPQPYGYGQEQYVASAPYVNENYYTPAQYPADPRQGYYGYGNGYGYEESVPVGMPVQPGSGRF